jgi:membrane protease subunit HflC
MRKLTLIIVAVIVLLAILIPQFVFVIDETKIAIVTRFGNIEAEIDEPGPYLKMPFIDSVTRYDKRLLIFDAPPNSLLTKDKKRLIIDVFARGRIVDPGTFRERLGDEQTAIDRAVSILSSELRTEVAGRNQVDIVTTQRDLMMENVLLAVQPKLAEFGLTVDDVRVKRVDYPEEIAESVYSRMRAERERIANRERAEGAEIDAQVRSDADRNATIILASATRDSSIISGCGEAEATAIFAKALNQDPEFYTFQRSLESFKQILDENTTVVLPLEGFGGLFEQVRSGIEKATEIDSEENIYIDSQSIGAKCAEVAAAWTLSGDLNIDQPDLEFVSITPKTWPNRTLGCVKGAKEDESGIPGFQVSFAYGGDIYGVRTNQYGSVVKTEESCE